MSDVSVTETAFSAWDDCLRLSNGVVELVATTGLGPRVLACGFGGGENCFYTDEAKRQLLGDFRIHGGHRLWHAPEDEDRTYVPDDDPVEWSTTDRGVRLVQPTEASTGIRKTMSLALAPDDPVVEVTHELANEGAWTVELAPWAVTVLRPGGTAVVPLSRGDPDDVLPDRSLAFWSYDCLADDRLTLADELVAVDQAVDAGGSDGAPGGHDGAHGVDGPFKIGATGADEWAAYLTDGVAFVKEFAYDPDAAYPDGGSAVEVYASGESLELETLGPLRPLEPGESAVHTETWRLLEVDPAASVEAQVETVRSALD